MSTPRQSTAVKESTKVTDKPSLDLRSLANFVPALIGMYNVQTNEYVYVNGAAKKILGYSPKQFIEGGSGFVASLVHPDDLPAINKQNLQTIKKIQRARSITTLPQAPIVSFEYRMRHKKGHYVWLQTDGSIYNWDAEGKIQHLINVSIDITERKQKELELQTLTSELEIRINDRSARLELALKTTGMGIWEWDTPSNQLVWSSELKKIFGLKPADNITFKQYMKLIHPDDREWTQKIIAKAMETGKPYSFEHRIVWSDKSVHWVYGMGRAFLKNGKVVRMLGGTINIDRQKDNEQRLLSSEERYQAFIQNSQEGIWRIEVEKPISIRLSIKEQIKQMYAYGYLAEANLAMAHMYGFDSVEPLIGLRLGDLLVQSDSKNNEYLTNFIKSGYNLSGVESFEKDKDGKDRIFRNSLVGIIENGTLVRGWGNQQDVTQIYKATQELAEGEELLKRQNHYLEVLHETAVEINTGLKNPYNLLETILERAGDMVTSHDGYIYIVNPSEDNLKVEVATGIYKEYIGHTIEKNDGLGGKIWQSGKPLIIDDYDAWSERQKSFPKGLVKAVIGLPLFSSNKVIGVLALSSDKPKEFFSHEQLHILIRLAELASIALDNARLYQSAVSQEERFRTMADNAPVFIWEAGQNMKCTYFNKQWLTFTGRKLKDELDDGWRDSIHPADIDSCVSIYENAFQAQEPFTQEYRLRRYDNTYHWILDTGVPRFSSSGKFIGFIGSCIDIEELKHTRELEKSTTLLTKQRAELLALNQAKDEFISLASHQLRTPATGVKQYLGILLEGYVGKLPQKQQKVLRTAYESNERQLTIIEDLLRVAHVDAGQIILRKQKADLVKLCEDVIKEHVSTFTRRDQKVSLKTSHKIINYFVDADKLRMALENIIDNSSKYTPAGKSITVGLEKQKDSVVIHVTDQGVGIAKKDMVKLFQKFSRVENPLSTSVGGSGLGLYWVKNIIDLHEGSIRVQSRVGKGTTFSITLPKTVS